MFTDSDVPPEPLPITISTSGPEEQVRPDDISHQCGAVECATTNSLILPHLFFTGGGHGVIHR